MKNTIWICRNASGRYVKLEDGSVPHYSSDVVHEIVNFLGVDVPMNESIQLIHDTDTGKTTVKSERKKAWYLTKGMIERYWIARYWNGENFTALPQNPQATCTYKEDELEIDETPLYSLFLKELE